MTYLYLIGSVFFVASTSILGGFYNRKNEGKKGTLSFYNFLIIGSVFIGWLVIFLFDRSFNVAVLPYSFLFAICYTACAIGTIYALKTGLVLLTSLMLQLSLIAVAIWGFIAEWQDPKWWTWLGLGLVAVALWLCLNSGKKSGDSNKLSWQWFVAVGVMFFGNAGCSIVQKTQQMEFDGKYGSFLMLVAMAISVTVCFALYMRDDRSESKEIFVASWYYPVVAGVANVLLNLAVMAMATSELSPSLIYPVLAVGSLIVTTIFSMVAFKEKMRWWQWLGVGLGMIATAILSV